MKDLKIFEGEFGAVRYEFSMSHKIRNDPGITTIEFKSTSDHPGSAIFKITGNVIIDVLAHKKYKITIEEVE